MVPERTVVSWVSAMTSPSPGQLEQLGLNLHADADAQDERSNNGDNSLPIAILSCAASQKETSMGFRSQRDCLRMGCS